MSDTNERTREPQYQFQIAHEAEHGRARLGIMTSASWHKDPRRILFLLSRYKFVAKMLTGKKKVLEVGCGDAFGTRMVMQNVESVYAVDFDPIFVKDVNERMDPDWKFECKVHDMLAGSVEGSFDAAYSLDVLEHILPADEDRFIANVTRSLTPDGTLIFGMPSLQSQPYASKESKEGHVNCKSEPDFRQLMLKYFHNVFMFSMNDEVLHTGYHHMAQYLFSLSVGPRRNPG